MSMLLLIGMQELLLVTALLFVAVPAFVIWLIVTVLRRRKQAATANTKRCPRCAELIHAAAQECRFCGMAQPA